MEKTNRMTKQRKKILEVLRNTKCHPTADWIYNQVREEMPNVSLGTIYRNLGLLKDKGEILELNYGSSFSRFDGNIEPHYHFACTSCERVFDIDIPFQANLSDVVMESTGNEVKEHRLEFYGTCKECRESNAN